MLKHEIDRLFTAKVTEYVSKGYYVHTRTMGGSQGEVAHIDLTNGVELLRVLLDRQFDIDTGDQIVLRVGRNAEALNSDTIWNHRLETLEERAFSKVSKNYYVAPEEYPAIRAKRLARYAARDNAACVDLGEKAKEIVLPFVRRQSKCKRAKLSDIENVRKSVNRGGKTIYTAQVKGKTYLIH